MVGDRTKKEKKGVPPLLERSLISKTMFISSELLSLDQFP